MTIRLFLFANGFPFGTWEPFLETECQYYSGFDEVHIISLAVRTSQWRKMRDVPAGMNVIPIAFRSRGFYLIQTVRALATGSFWREVGLLVRGRRMSARRLVKCVVHFSRAEYEAREVRRFIKKSVKSAPGDHSILYSYRFSYQPYLMSRVAPLLPNATLISRAHGGDLYESVVETGYIPGRLLNLSLVDRVSLISQNGLDYLRQGFPAYQELMTLDHLGTMDHGVAVLPGKRDPLRVVSCSSVVPVKALDRIIAAMSELPRSLKVEWTHYGDGPLMVEIQRLAAALPNNVSVHFPGEVSNESLLYALKEGGFHAFLNSSRSEGLPVSIMEAFSFGVPVIASDVRGTGEIVIDQVNGYLVKDCGEPQALAEAMIAIADLPDDAYRKMRDSARSTWAGLFNADVNYPKFVESLLPSASLADRL